MQLPVTMILLWVVLKGCVPLYTNINHFYQINWALIVIVADFSLNASAAQ